MSSKRLDKISDYRRHGYHLRIKCLHCKRNVIIDPAEIMHICLSQGKSQMTDAVIRRLRCAECGSRRIELSPTERPGR